tara:strand:- start:63491 stop:65128 length:1638 start_codon:yes stop_codon:yes gene_type:complete
MPTQGLKKGNAFKAMIPAAVGCVCSYCPVASAVGTRVLQDGGNAVDAAVATGLALAITYPQAGNLGGGGFMIVKAPGKDAEFLDYRESAPMKVEPSMFLTKEGQTSEATVTGPLSVAVPGTVAGLAAALEKYGNKSWDRIVSSVLELAEQGIWITNRQARYLSVYRSQLRQFESTAKAFFHLNELRPGDLFRQPDLAKTLRALADNGPDEFYTGAIGKRMAAELGKFGGVLDEEDLASYKPVWRRPFERDFFGKRVISTGLPSGGGMVLLKSLGLLEASGIEHTEIGSVERYELLARVFRVAFKGRSTYAGDPSRLSQQELEKVERLSVQKYSKDSLREFEIEGGFLEPQAPVVGEMPPRNTTHFCAIDTDGMAVSNTYSLNTLFGSKFVCEGTGILMNNTIDDFGVAPGVPNWYSLFEGENNLLSPGARPIGSMSPTLVLDKEGRCEIAIGASGGPRIPTLVAQVLVNMLVSGKSLKEAMQMGRVHHQNLPPEIQLEDSVGWDMARALEARGMPVTMFPRLGIGAAIRYSIDKKHFQASLDGRF